MPKPSEKKPAQRNLFTDVVVIDDHEEEAVEGPPAIQRIHRQKTKRPAATTTSLQSPQKKKSRTTAVAVTPEDIKISASKETTSKEELSKHVPTYLHKNVEYLTTGKATLSDVQRQALEWITKRYEIPVDLEQSRQYGPLSGTCYEERILQAYSLKQLPRRKSAPDAETDICTACAKVGHQKVDCSTLI